MLSLPDVPSPSPRVWWRNSFAVQNQLRLTVDSGTTEVLAVAPNDLTIGLFALSRVQIISPCLENEEQLLPFPRVNLEWIFGEYFFHEY